MESDVIIYTLSDSTTLTVYCESLHVFFFSFILFYSKQVIIDLLLLVVKVPIEVVEGGGGGVIIMLISRNTDWLCNRVYCIHVPGHDPLIFSLMMMMS